MVRGTPALAGRGEAATLEHLLGQGTLPVLHDVQPVAVGCRALDAPAHGAYPAAVGVVGVLVSCVAKNNMDRVSCSVAGVEGVEGAFAVFAA